VIRLFKVYYPVRTLVLLAGETLIVGLSFVLGTIGGPVVLFLASTFSSPERSLQFKNALFIEGGRLAIPGLTTQLANLGRIDFLRIIGLTGVVLLISHVADLYDSSRLAAKMEQVLRLLLVLGLVAAVMGVALWLGFSFLPGAGSAISGVIILTAGLFLWRYVYSWLERQPYFRERVYVLGTGDRAQRLLEGLRQRSELRIEVVGWTGNIRGEQTRETLAADLVTVAQEKGVHRVIVAMPDRRGTLPVEELLDLRLKGVKVEEVTSWLEKMSGRIEVEQLYPSWLIFAEGFRFTGLSLVRRLFSSLAAAAGLLLALPLLPFVALAIKLDTPGFTFRSFSGLRLWLHRCAHSSVLYHQKRVGRMGAEFYCHKFRTMCEDAEADTGATWALDDDPRITRMGRLLRVSRLDEIPQLWCVLVGDMDFVGPRPERPEFVERLSRVIPYYGVRHFVRPGITGWAQVRYKYGNTLDDAREKLQYDLFYIKNASIGLDFWIVFQTIRIVIRGRGAQ
jgi:sugar transferase (PEP-CTERM system associated)